MAGTEQLEIVLDKPLSVGRKPTGNGLVIAESDEYVSANALQVLPKKDGVEVKNTSSHAQLEIHHQSGVRFLFPGESLTVTQSSKVVIPSNSRSYLVEVVMEERRKSRPEKSQTRRLIPEDLTIADERVPALAGLCAALLLPQRFGSSLLKASEIARMLTANGYGVTAKGVNHKIQRTREQVEEYTGNSMDDRESLAQFLIRSGIINVGHVEQFILGIEIKEEK